MGNAVQYEVLSFRNGHRVVPQAAFKEICAALDAIDIEDVQRKRQELQAKEAARAAGEGSKPQKIGVQKILNRLLRERLSTLEEPWTSEVRLFDEDKESGKGLWTMDFRKAFGPDAVGVEITFNHAEALAWTPVRLDLAHEADGVRPEAVIMAGIIVIGKDSMKKHKVPRMIDGRHATTKGGKPRYQTVYLMDGAVGTFERFLTVLPKMRNYVKVPLLVFGLDWRNGPGDRSVRAMDLNTSRASIRDSADARI